MGPPMSGCSGRRFFPIDVRPGESLLLTFAVSGLAWSRMLVRATQNWQKALKAAAAPGLGTMRRRRRSSPWRPDVGRPPAPARAPRSFVA